MAKGEEHPHYRIEFTSAALRDMERLPKVAVRRLDRHILALADNPWPRGSKKLTGQADLHRVRVGDYRIIYKVEQQVLLVLVIRIRHRGGAYRGLP